MKLIQFINQTIRIVCITLIIIIIFTTFFQVIVRYLFSSSYTWVEETAIWSMVWIIFLGSVLGIVEDAHPKVDFFTNLLPSKAKGIVESFSNLVCAIVAALLGYYSIDLVQSNFHKISVGLQIPISILYLSLLIGSVLMALFFLVKAYESIRGAFGKGVEN
ncbi:TRAP transporter small permease [Bacillus sp. FJAT-29937]|uniref:TRAP transporter small permease n=1 Tax=Bacillus sp. FJAT-29937 TaxID=1720553 RepID=UPI00082BCADD|nr:TRAP transporter small permease [Bacillus sp. FJAT-29937]